MFAADSLTPPVAAYLQDEMTPLESDPDLDHLFEVGCGRGLHLSWASARGLRYDGLDLVAWPADREGLLATPAGDLAAAPLRRRLHVGSSEDLHALWSAEGLRLGARSTLVVFPFNCFGSLARPEKTVASVARARARLYLSMFSTAPDTTARRLEFYARSGYTELRALASDRGVLITSAEGLHSWAYEEPYVLDLLGSEGYACERRAPLAEIGVGLFFHSPHARVAEPPSLGGSLR